MNFYEVFAMAMIVSLYVSWVVWVDGNNLYFHWGPNWLS